MPVAALICGGTGEIRKSYNTSGLPYVAPLLRDPLLRVALDGTHSGGSAARRHGGSRDGHFRIGSDLARLRKTILGLHRVSTVRVVRVEGRVSVDGTGLRVHIGRHRQGPSLVPTVPWTGRPDFVCRQNQVGWSSGGRPGRSGVVPCTPLRTPCSRESPRLRPNG